VVLQCNVQAGVCQLGVEVVLCVKQAVCRTARVLE
jgi:hypothetical protein